MAPGPSHRDACSWSRGSIALDDRHKTAFAKQSSAQTSLQAGAPGSSGALPLRHAVQHDVLLAEFEPRIGPGLDILSQRLRALLPIVAVHATVGLWGSFRVTHGIEPQAIEGVAHDQFA